jgi:RimJ/RimL family protein N-acetyltransferase
MLIPIIKTQRLILRGFRQEDLEAYGDMCKDGEVMRYLGGKSLPRSEAWRNMSMIAGHWMLRGYGMWAVEESKTGEMIGRVGCWYPEGWPGFEIGWTLRRAFWRQGFATEAGKAAMNYAFRELQQPEVISLINPENIASRTVAEKLGERVSGKTEIFGHEVLIYKITKDEWEVNVS